MAKTNIPKRFVLCLSGGIDSTTILADLMSMPSRSDVLLVTFKYPSKHNKLERKAAAGVANYYEQPLRTVDVTDVFSGSKSSMVNNDRAIPEGHYKAETMKSTVVPLRNVVFASIAGAVGQEVFGTKAYTVVVGVHAGDHAIYPDCRPKTIHFLNATFLEGSDNQISVVAPYIGLTKAEIVKIGLKLGAPYNITRTCYNNKVNGCGKCGSCIERLEAFNINGHIDPIKYDFAGEEIHLTE